MKGKGLLSCLCVLTALLLSVGNDVIADTDVSGFIFEDTVWTKAKSPYIVKDGIVVDDGATLTIEPGVTVKFEGNKAIEIDGKLLAKGKKDKKITFTRNETDNWGYIMFSDSSVDAVFDEKGNYLGGSIMDYCVVEYAGGAKMTYNGAIKLENASPFIDHCRIQNNAGYGIYARNEKLSGKLEIYNSTISYNGGGGIVVSRGGNYEIFNNFITYNMGCGISVQDWYTTLSISHNVISNNTSLSLGGGIYAQYYIDEINISHNLIINNSSTDKGGGIYAYFPTIGKVSLYKNILSNNTSKLGAGIYSDSYYSTANNSELVVSNNSFVRNSGANASAIFCDNIGKGVEYNTITDNNATDTNSSVVFVRNQPPGFNYNNIFGDSAVYELWNDNGKESVYYDMDARFNWWGTSNETEIRDRIFDFFDDSFYGVVDYGSYDKSLRTDAPISPPTGLSVTPGNKQISVKWKKNAESDTIGYKVYWDSDGEYPYAKSFDVGNTTEHIITNLAAKEYHVTVTAYDNQYIAGNDDPATIVNENQTNGNESWFAEEAVVQVTSGLCKAEKITGDPASLSLRKNQSSDITVTVTGANGCLSEGQVVTATVTRGKNLIPLKSVNETTDEDGNATFTIKAKSAVGNARIKFKAGDASMAILVKVTK